MSLIKENIDALEIAPELKADIKAIFDQIEGKETELVELKKKVPTDSQKVVESVDFAKYEAATKELDTLKSDLALKLQQEGGRAGKGILAAFPMFFE